MTPSIHFTLSFSEPQAHYVEVQMHIKSFTAFDYIDLKMPVWAPGSYLIREYPKNIERFSVSSTDGKELKAYKTSKNTWRVDHKKNDIIVKYAVYAFENSVRTSHIDYSHAFLSPVGVFMYIHGYLYLPCDITVNPPPHWSKISTGLERASTSNSYHAANFDILYDSPLEIGNQDTWSFEVEGVPHEFAMVGIADYDREQLSADVSKIVAEENSIWGSNPNQHYTFVTHNYQNAHGGLEHLNSTILAASRYTYSQPNTYKAYLSLVAHEYFHLWNVKRLRPTALGPFDYEQENYTTGLWIMEGFTSYYDNLIIRRCGFYNEREYLQQLAIDFNTVYNRPGYELQSAAMSSFDTWIKQYRPDENSHNTSISYYNKGAMLAVAMDLKIIADTQGKYRLDDVLKAAYKQFYLIENRGFEEEELLRLAEQVTGVDLQKIFQAAHSLEELDYNIYFNRVGYQLVDHNAGQSHATLGIKVAHSEGKSIIKQVDRASGAWLGGLNVEDELIAINGHRIDPQGKALDHILTQAKVHDTVNVLIARDGIVSTLEITVLQSDKKAFSIEAIPNIEASTAALGKLWLSL
ncbi:M61 family metallopeptidase [Sphingobacterium faecale]|uniref:M61 family metallopeptidase n=1 Tax=Sphingobacterium faecale TaxID=2803775 RepID=A0ABS1R6Z3_9SPHI|nr:PDZ domain-containing protein [Sphingobacterium faecale]MBL1410004.1 M61 family metallopeptidase [Sphingobacterium faecale]